MIHDIPPYVKPTITVEEAAALTNIGTKKLYELAKQDYDCRYQLRDGNRILFKRERFYEFLDSASRI